MNRGTASAAGGDGSRWTGLASLCASMPVSASVRSLLDQGVQRTAEFFAADCCLAFLRVDGGTLLTAWVGLPAGPSRREEIAPRGLPRYVDRLLAPVRSRRFMSAPMVAGEREIGDLVVCSLREEQPPYSPLDRRMLGLVAHRLGVGVEDGRLLERARGQREALARIAAALVREVELRKVADTAVELAVRELGADAATVWTAELGERRLDMVASIGFGPEIVVAVGRLGFDAPALAAVAAATMQMQVVERPEQLPESMTLTKRLFADAGLQSVVAAPLVARGKLMGVLAFSSKTPHRWTEEELTVVGTLADLLAAAIFNAHSFEESERRRLLAEAVIENSPMGIVVLAGPEHRYVLVNAARERITGMTRERSLGRTFAEVLPDLAKDPVGEALDRVYRTGETVVIPDYHYDYGPPAGARDVSMMFAPLQGPSGQIEGIISLMLDITQQVAARRRLEELTSELKAANERLTHANLQSAESAELAQQRAAELEATLANIADAVFVCNPQGVILLINRAGLEMIGVERPSDVRTLADYLEAIRPRYLGGQPVPREELAITRALRGEVVRGVEEIVHDSRSGQDRYILVSAAPVRDGQGESIGAVEVQSDITALKELDLLKDQFITVAAHEIKTPVTAIKGFAQTLLRAPDACAPRYHKALETIVQQSNRIDALVRDFLEVSRMRWGRVDVSLERMDLSALAAEVVARTRPPTPRHRLLLSRQDTALVEGDRERLDQVLVNLLDNAFRYSPEGGEVEVQVRREADRVVVSVRDQGVGIPKDRQAHVFERFYRAHIGTPYDYGGLGVGLYISREIVRRHGGQMWFETEEGKGSTFYFSLPLAEAPPPSQKTAARGRT